MFETHVTVVGNVITAIGKRRFDDGTVVANFRVASTERRYARDAGTARVQRRGAHRRHELVERLRQPPTPR